MRCITVGKAGAAPMVSEIVTQLGQVLAVVSKNPSKPQFNHFLFEAFGSAIRYCGPAHPESVKIFEGALFPIFDHLLKNEVEGRAQSAVSGVWSHGQFLCLILDGFTPFAPRVSPLLLPASCPAPRADSAAHSSDLHGAIPVSFGTATLGVGCQFQSPCASAPGLCGQV